MNKNEHNQAQHEGALHKILVVVAIGLFIMGRLCDDLNWYEWPGISSDGLEGIALAGVGGAAVVIIILRSMQKDGLKHLFLNSALKFFIPWALIILECILIFKIWGCTRDPELVAEHPEYLSHTGCSLLCVVLLLSTFVYSSICNEMGQKAFLFVFQIIMFAEIIYSGHLLVKFINQLKEQPKDYSILYISVMIGYLIVSMDLMFRAAYQDKESEEKIQQIHEKINQHHGVCRLISEINKQQTEVRLYEELPQTKKLNEVHAPKKESHHPQ